jgi:hypothetical protein
MSVYRDDLAAFARFPSDGVNAFCQPLSLTVCPVPETGEVAVRSAVWENGPKEPSPEVVNANREIPGCFAADADYPSTSLRGPPDRKRRPGTALLHVKQDAGHDAAAVASFERARETSNGTVIAFL